MGVHRCTRSRRACSSSAARPCSDGTNCAHPGIVLVAPGIAVFALGSRLMGSLRTTRRRLPLLINGLRRAPRHHAARRDRPSRHRNAVLRAAVVMRSDVAAGPDDRGRLDRCCTGVRGVRGDPLDPVPERCIPGRWPAPTCYGSPASSRSFSASRPRHGPRWPGCAPRISSSSRSRRRPRARGTGGAERGWPASCTMACAGLSWLAKLKARQVAVVAGMPSAARPLLAETEAAIDSGLNEARQAVLALRMAADGEEGFCELMRQYANDFEDRFGMRVEYACEGDPCVVAPRPRPRSSALPRRRSRTPTITPRRRSSGSASRDPQWLGDPPRGRQRMWLRLPRDRCEVVRPALHARAGRA